MADNKPKETPYDKYLDPEARRWGLLLDHPKAVVGDVTFIEYPEVNLIVIWRMVSDVAMADRQQWRPLGYVETYGSGRMIANSREFKRYIARPDNGVRVPFKQETAETPRIWQEVDVRAWMDHRAANSQSLCTLLDPRGTIPKRAIPMWVQGEIIPDYRATYTYFPEGSPERRTLMENTWFAGGDGEPGGARNTPYHEHYMVAYAESVVVSLAEERGLKREDARVRHQEQAYVAAMYNAVPPGVLCGQEELRAVATMHTLLNLRERRLHYRYKGNQKTQVHP